MRLEQDRRLRIADGVAGGRVFEAGRGDDLAGDRFVESLALLRVNAETGARPSLFCSFAR